MPTPIMSHEVLDQVRQLFELPDNVTGEITLRLHTNGGPVEVEYNRAGINRREPMKDAPQAIAPDRDNDYHGAAEQPAAKIPAGAKMYMTQEGGLTITPKYNGATAEQWARTCDAIANERNAVRRQLEETQRELNKAREITQMQAGEVARATINVRNARESLADVVKERDELRGSLASINSAVPLQYSQGMQLGFAVARMAEDLRKTDSYNKELNAKLGAKEAELREITKQRDEYRNQIDAIKGSRQCFHARRLDAIRAVLPQRFAQMQIDDAVAELVRDMDRIGEYVRKTIEIKNQPEDVAARVALLCDQYRGQRDNIDRLMGEHDGVSDVRSAMKQLADIVTLDGKSVADRAVSLAAKYRELYRLHTEATRMPGSDATKQLDKIRAAIPETYKRGGASTIDAVGYMAGDLKTLQGDFTINTAKETPQYQELDRRNRATEAKLREAIIVRDAAQGLLGEIRVALELSPAIPAGLVVQAVRNAHTAEKAGIANADAVRAAIPPAYSMPTFIESIKRMADRIESLRNEKQDAVREREQWQKKMDAVDNYVPDEFDRALSTVERVVLLAKAYRAATSNDRAHIAQVSSVVKVANYYEKTVRDTWQAITAELGYSGSSDLAVAVAELVERVKSSATGHHAAAKASNRKQRAIEQAIAAMPEQIREIKDKSLADRVKMLAAAYDELRTPGVIIVYPSGSRFTIQATVSHHNRDLRENLLSVRLY